VGGRVLITGASRGIGRALAEELLGRGYEVVATARRLDSLTGVPSHVRLELDVTDEEAVRRALAEAEPIDVLVNNAGVGVGGPTEEVPIGEAMWLFDTNFFGAAQMIKAVLPQMRDRAGGTIVNISSLSARVPWPFGGYYAASKAALEALSEALEIEVSPLGIRVMLVEPGVVDTEFGKAFRDFGADASAYADLRSRWSRQFEGTHISAEVVAARVAEALEQADSPLRVHVGEDAERVLELRRQFGDAEFDEHFRSHFGLPARRGRAQ
jgi:NAD(P)-dependent dehydrogenase (short-subunit alcohol dehydrogenase family)